MPVFPMSPPVSDKRAWTIPAIRWLLAWGAVLVGTSPLQISAEERVLQRAGLRQLEGTSVWLLEDEFRLQSLLGELEPLHRRILRLQADLTAAATENLVLWEATRQQSQALREKLAQAPTGDPQRPQWERQLRRLASQGVEPGKLPGVAPVRALLVQLTDHRLRLALSVLSIRRLHQQLRCDYERLANDPHVTRALRAQGEQHRLGPRRKGYDIPVKRLERHEALVFTDWVPLYQQSDRMRFGGIMHERVPAVFTWDEESQETLLPATLVESAGVPYSEQGELVELSWGNRRRLPARRITLSTLRFGGIVLYDVPALMLPPEGEDLGPRIGPASFSGYAVEREPERLRVRFRPL